MLHAACSYDSHPLICDVFVWYVGLDWVICCRQTRHSADCSIRSDSEGIVEIASVCHVTYLSRCRCDMEAKENVSRIVAVYCGLPCGVRFVVAKANGSRWSGGAWSLTLCRGDVRWRLDRRREMSVETCHDTDRAVANIGYISFFFFLYWIYWIRNNVIFVSSLTDFFLYIKLNWNRSNLNLIIRWLINMNGVLVSRIHIY